jgi:UDP-glucose 4-epimerase
MWWMVREFRILVTGGAGFIGSHLTERLLETDNEVVVLDDFSTGSKENLEAASKFSGLKLVKGDVRKVRTVEALVKKVDCVYHLAAKSLPVSLQHPKIVHEVNDKGTFNVCLAARKAKLKCLVYVSSSVVYGTAQYVPIDENHPLQPRTPYCASKAAGEMHVRSFVKVWGVPAVIVRPFNSYGPRANVGVYSSVIPSFVDRCLVGKPPVIYGNGEQTRDFTYISDTVDGIVEAGDCGNLVGDVVNVAHGEEVSVKRIADIVLDQTGMKDKVYPVFENPRPGDVRRQVADISKAEKMFHFKPKVSIEEGIEKYIKWRKTCPFN